MKLHWEGRKGMSLGEFCAVILGLGFSVPLLAGILSATPGISLHESIFQFLPPLIFVAAACSVILVFAGRMRRDQALALTAHLAASACGAAALLSALHIWNDGSLFPVLTPGTAGISILTLGILPFSSGPQVLVRFLPAIFSLGLGFILYRRSSQGSRAWLTAFAFYAIAAFLTQAPAWAAWLASGSVAGAEDARDILRVWANLQLDGYWTEGQTDRFLAPLGRQAETAILAWQAGIFFISSALVLAWTGIKFLAWKKILRRLVDFEPVAAVLIALTLARAAWFVRPGSWGVVNITALFVFIIALVSWLLWRRLTKDASLLARHETEHPDYPLPSGAVALHDLEFLSRILLAVALFGAALLGWQIVLGFTAASLAVWLFSICAWDATRELKILGLVLTYVFIGWTGLAFGTRSGMFFPDLMYFLLGLALLTGALEYLRDGWRELAGQRGIFWAAAAILAALALAREPEAWAPGIIAILAAAYLYIKNGLSAQKYGLWPLYFVAGLFVLIGLFLPKILLS